MNIPALTHVYLARQIGWGECHPLGVFYTYEQAQEACGLTATGPLFWGELGPDHCAESIARGDGGWVYRIDEMTVGSTN